MAARLAVRGAVCSLALLASARVSGEELVYELTAGPAGSVRVVERPGPLASRRLLPGLKDPRAALRRWVEASAGAVAGYYGRLPVERVTLAVELGGRSGIGGGVTHGGPRGARIDLGVGRDVTEADLGDDWVLTHELVHTALPRLPRESAWLDEGIATYVEPIARVRHGGLAADKVWEWLAWGLPQGLPESGDRGLDHTRTWGRTYWGGALFCFLADVELRERSADRVSLREALRGVLAAGGDITVEWGLAEVLAAADRATGRTVLTDLHSRLGPTPVDPDLPALFRRLGVKARRGAVTYDATAPLDSLRELLPAGDTRQTGK